MQERFVVNTIVVNRKKMTEKNVGELCVNTIVGNTICAALIEIYRRSSS